MDEQPLSSEPKRQTLESRRTLSVAAERATLVHAGSWRSSLAHTRYTPCMASGHSRCNTTKQTSESSADQATLEPSTRVIQWQHFETALLEIGPSSTEDGTLPELRKVRDSDVLDLMT